MPTRSPGPPATLVLPSAVQSVREARRFCAAQLGGLPEDTVDAVTLLVSELVTNAVLHAESEVELRVTRFGDAVRVDVADGSPLLPAPRPYGETAATGRGLKLVEALASGFGVEWHAGGKTVWFTVGPTGERPVSGSGWGHRDPGGERGRTGAGDDVAVVLRGLPLAPYLVLQQQNEALLREYVLLSAEQGPRNEQVAAAERAQGVLAAAVAAAAAAGSAHTDRVDVPLTVPRACVADFEALRDVLTEAVLLAARGRMLCRPTLPELRNLRAWCLDQVAAAAAGEPSLPWAPPDEVPDDELALPLLELDTAALLDPQRAMVAADDGNRILAVTAPAARLLGWSPDELVGRRLVTLIPHRLHEAHVAGFTRLLLNGQPRLLGRPVVLPARHRDGSEIPVTVRITSRPAGDGRLVFVAEMSASDHLSSEPSPPP